MLDSGIFTWYSTSMRSIRTLSWDSSSLLKPPFRKVFFDDEPGVVYLSTELRLLWSVLPEDPGSTGPEAVIAAIKARNALSPEERKTAWEQNPDKDDLKTPWRTAIAYQWNHVFFDVSSFLFEAAHGVGHFHSARSDVLGLPFPPLDEDEEAKKTSVVEKVWETNVLLLPGHLEDGVSVSVTVVKDGVEGNKEEEAFGSFGSDNPAEIWFIKSGVRLRFFIEYKGMARGTGITAVMMFELLCSENHDCAP